MSPEEVSYFWLQENSVDFSYRYFSYLSCVFKVQRKILIGKTEGPGFTWGAFLEGTSQLRSVGALCLLSWLQIETFQTQAKIPVSSASWMKLCAQTPSESGGLKD